MRIVENYTQTAMLTGMSLCVSVSRPVFLIERVGVDALDAVIGC